MYFSFSYLPIRRFDRQEEAFPDGPPPAPRPASCLGNKWIGGRGIFSDVMFHSETQYENHDSKTIVNHFITRLPDISGRLSPRSSAMISVERGAE